MPNVTAPVPAPSISCPMEDARHRQAEPATRSFAFGPFILRPEQQLLLRHDEPIRIGGRALDILTVLVEQPGEIVDKQTLLLRVWPSTFVEETNLKVNLAGLRRALGDCPASPLYIATVVGRGYRFIASVRSAGSLAPPLNRHRQTEAPNINELIETIDTVRRQLAQYTSGDALK